MRQNASLSIKIDKDIQFQAENTFQEHGVSIATAIEALINQVAVSHKIPLGLHLPKMTHTPNKETQKVLKEIQIHASGKPSKSIKSFKTAKEMFESLEK